MPARDHIPALPRIPYFSSVPSPDVSCHRIVGRYSPPRSRLPRGTSPGDGPGLGAGATCAVFRLLCRYGLHVLAAEVTGLNAAGGEGIETRSADVFMRR